MLVLQRLLIGYISFVPSCAKRFQLFLITLLCAAVLLQAVATGSSYSDSLPFVFSCLFPNFDMLLQLFLNYSLECYCPVQALESDSRFTVLCAALLFEVVLKVRAVFNFFFFSVVLLVCSKLWQAVPTVHE